MIIGAIVALVIVAGGSFYAGMQYANAARTARFAAAGSAGGAFGGRGPGGMRGAGFTAGSIIAKDATSITIKMQNGSTKIVLVSPSTQIMKAATGTLDDLAIGTNVVVNGSANADQSVTATSVQIRPQGFGTSTPAQ